MNGVGEQGVGMIGSRRVAAVLMVVYAIVVAFIVFAPTAEVPSNSVRVIWRVLQNAGAPDSVTPNRVEFITNMLLFVPLSLLGSTFRPRWGWAAWFAVGLGLSACVELGQMLFLPGRSPALDDIAANTLGALLGYGIVVLVRLLTRPRRR